VATFLAWDDVQDMVKEGVLDNDTIDILLEEVGMYSYIYIYMYIYMYTFVYILNMHKTYIHKFIYIYVHAHMLGVNKNRKGDLTYQQFGDLVRLLDENMEALGDEIYILYICIFVYVYIYIYI
jgi:hypothetical protein